uniref:Uncharacterized protein n=1 Tax=Anguilla anguilla TaxID=7936 RepID=A0A0E9WZH6_ANGAN
MAILREAVNIVHVTRGGLLPRKRQVMLNHEQAGTIMTRHPAHICMWHGQAQ